MACRIGQGVPLDQLRQRGVDADDPGGAGEDLLRIARSALPPIAA